MLFAAVPSVAFSGTERNASTRNVLYIVFDDLRPELGFYGAAWMRTPHLDRLAASGTVFDHAYCQETVCSPSRMSFTTGRRPNTTQAWNFLNHFRQAECPGTVAGVRLSGTPLAGTRHGAGVSFTGISAGTSGGSGQCCTDCVATAGCKGWQLSGDGASNVTCVLFSALDADAPQACESSTNSVCISGVGGGSLPTWTPLPEHLRKQGWLTLGVGKYFHDTNQGLGVAGDDRFPPGTGLPPEADPPSWSNVSVQNRNVSELQARYGRHLQLFKGTAYTGGAGLAYVDAMDGCINIPGKQVGRELCAADLPANGSNAADLSTTPPCDYIAYEDAKDKLRYAAAQRASTGQPFFLAVGIRRPHLTWRVPKAYLDMYPAAQTRLPVQAVLDKSIDPIAWTQFKDLGGEQPYERTNTARKVREYRAAYYAASSWADYVAGQVLTELDALQLADSTLVVMHADHGGHPGWHLGEYNMWEKRTLWENAARVPLVLRAPWLPKSVGARVGAPVELVDVYRTVCDALGVPLPQGETHHVEGVSLVPLLREPRLGSLGAEGAGGWSKDAALTTYPRCPKPGLPDWESSSCIHSTERTDFGYMGYSMFHRNAADGSAYRYTEWLRWNGTALRPELNVDVKAVELDGTVRRAFGGGATAGHRRWGLYNHTSPLPLGTSVFDAYENVNLAPTADKGLLAYLRHKLRSEFALA